MAAAIDAVYDDEITAGLVASAVAAVEGAGRSNSLGEKLVQLTTTGMPDVYQGSELWDLSLVDPDNRRPVDYGLRSDLLAAIEAGEPPVLEEGADDTGAVKLLVTTAALTLHRDRPELFEGYTPLEPRGSAARHAVAFDRGGAITVVTRLPIGLARHGGWDDTTLELPEARNGYADALTGRLYRDGSVRLAELLGTYPVALLQRIES